MWNMDSQVPGAGSDIEGTQLSPTIIWNKKRKEEKKKKKEKQCGCLTVSWLMFLYLRALLSSLHVGV